MVISSFRVRLLHRVFSSFFAYGLVPPSNRKSMRAFLPVMHSFSKESFADVSGLYWYFIHWRLYLDVCVLKTRSCEVYLNRERRDFSSPYYLARIPGRFFTSLAKDLVSVIFLCITHHPSQQRSEYGLHGVPSQQVFQRTGHHLTVDLAMPATWVASPWPPAWRPLAVTVTTTFFVFLSFFSFIFFFS